MTERFPSVLREAPAATEPAAEERPSGMEMEPVHESLEGEPAAMEAPAPADDDGLGVAPPGLGGKRPKGAKRRAVSGSLLRVDGSSEVTRVGLL